jgi:hypothetical protein
MKRLVIALGFITLLSAAPSFASCGSANCPIETQPLNSIGRLSFDLNYQYLDQNTAMIDTHVARVGEVHTHADEIYSRNKITTLGMNWMPRNWMQLGISLPYVERDHFHLASTHDAKLLAPLHNTIPQRWTMSSPGDVLLQGRFRVARSRSGNALWLTAGAELPTGEHHFKNASGLEAEPMLQPGSGSLDAVIGISATGGFTAPGLRRGQMGNSTLVPLFASASFKINGHDGAGYRSGNELQLNAGSAYPLPAGIDLLLQLNGRIRSRDHADPADEDAVEDAEFTGGRQLYVTPGFRYNLPRGAAIYALVQLPVYQKVNGLQLTSDYNLVGGIQLRR